MFVASGCFHEAINRLVRFIAEPVRSLNPDSLLKAFVHGPRGENFLFFCLQGAAAVGYVTIKKSMPNLVRRIPWLVALVMHL